MDVILTILALLAIGGLVYVVVKLRLLLGYVGLLMDKVQSNPVKAETQTAEKPDPLDEGIENIMTYSVLGKTGLEQVDK